MKTEEQRKSDMHTMAIYLSIVMGLLVSYILGLAVSVGTEFGLTAVETFFELYNRFSQFNFLPCLNGGFLIGALAGLLSIPILYFVFETDNQRNYSYKSDEVAGSGGFMTAKDKKSFDTKYVDEAESTKAGEPSPYMIMSQHFRRPIDSYKLIGNSNAVVLGGAGGGKTRFYIKPNILQMNASFVVTDPSGEIIYALGDMLSKNGYRIKIFNVTDMTHSNGYNPLHYIRDPAGIAMLVDVFIRNTTDEGAKGDQFFPNAERLLYTACIYYLKDHCEDSSRKNFAEIARLINTCEPSKLESSELDMMFAALPHDSTAKAFYNGFKKAADKTMQSILISCMTRIQPFMNSSVANLTRYDELELDKMGYEKTALFIICPQADLTYSFLTSMLYSQAFETWYHQGEQQKLKTGSERLPIPIRCLMDEFRNIGEIPAFPSKVSTMRKYNISSTIILQDTSQIEFMYKDEWRTIMGNASSTVYLGTQEPNTNKYFSEMLGKMTITSRSRGVSKGGKSGGGSNRNFQQTSREVMTPDELGRLDKNYCIVFTQNHRPYIDKKYDYTKHPSYPLTGDANPDNAFIYSELAAYDVNKLIHITALMKAEQEYARRCEEKIASDSKDAKDVEFEGDLYTVLDKLQLKEKESNRIKTEYVQMLSKELFTHMRDAIPVVRLKGIPYKMLPEVIALASAQTGVKKMVVFSDMRKTERMLGIGYDNENGDLMRAMDNDIAKQFRKVDDVYSVIEIYPKAFSSYRCKIIELVREGE